MEVTIVSRHQVNRASLLVPFVILGACALGDDLGPELTLDPELELFVDLVNTHRESVGCPDLEWNSSVALVAQSHSEDMVQRGFFDHTNPDGESPFDRLAGAGISYSRAAENIAAGQPTAQVVLDAWLNSSGHRANIENCLLTEHGVGLEDRHWTHLFIRP
jgi:uncharacterized protein YkwD